MDKGEVDFVKSLWFEDSSNILNYTFCIDKDKWDNFNVGFDINKKNWRTVKFYLSNGVINPAISTVKNVSGVFMCILKSENIPINHYSFIVFIDGTTKSLRSAIEDFIKIKESSYLYNSEIRELFSVYKDNLYVSYYVDKDINHVVKLKNGLLNLINPPIKNSKILVKGKIENGFK